MVKMQLRGLGSVLAILLAAAADAQTSAPPFEQIRACYQGISSRLNPPQEFEYMSGNGGVITRVRTPSGASGGTEEQRFIETQSYDPRLVIIVPPSSERGSNYKLYAIQNNVLTEYDLGSTLHPGGYRFSDIPSTGVPWCRKDQEGQCTRRPLSLRIREVDVNGQKKITWDGLPIAGATRPREIRGQVVRNPGSLHLQAIAQDLSAHLQGAEARERLRNSGSDSEVQRRLAESLRYLHTTAFPACEGLRDALPEVAAAATSARTQLAGEPAREQRADLAPRGGRTTGP